MSSFKESLLHAKSSNLPKCVRDLVDVGLVQECETIDGIHYISFAFQLHDAAFYNYRNNVYKSDFIAIAFADVMYAGGFAVNDDGNILKGIIYPYYYNFHSEEDCEMFGVKNILVPYTKGTPQIINKADKLKLNNFFVSNKYFRAFNLATNLSDTWVNFASGKESYANTYMMCDEEENLFEPNDWNDFTFYGHVKCEKDFQYKFTHKYTGQSITKSNAITVSFVEKKLEDNSILSSIANKIFCVNETIKGQIESAKIVKEGMEFIGNSNQCAGINIRKGVSNIANAVNPRPDIKFYG